MRDRIDKILSTLQEEENSSKETDVYPEKTLDNAYQCNTPNMYLYIRRRSNDFVVL